MPIYDTVSQIPRCIPYRISNYPREMLILTSAEQYHEIVQMRTVLSSAIDLVDGADNFLESLHVAKTDVLISASLIFPYFVSHSIPVSIKLSKNV